jgi:hypothetical protein
MSNRVAAGTITVRCVRDRTALNPRRVSCGLAADTQWNNVGVPSTYQLQRCGAPKQPCGFAAWASKTKRKCLRSFPFGFLVGTAATRPSRLGMM